MWMCQAKLLDSIGLSRSCRFWAERGFMSFLSPFRIFVIRSMTDLVTDLSWFFDDWFCYVHDHLAYDHQKSSWTKFFIRSVDLFLYNQEFWGCCSVLTELDRISFRFTRYSSELHVWPDIGSQTCREVDNSFRMNFVCIVSIFRCRAHSCWRISSTIV